jgi:hypothetical protein
VQTGEGEIQIRFDTRRTRDPKARSVLHHVFQQCRLTDARLAPQDEDLTLPGPGARCQALQRLALITSAKQALRWIFRHSHHRI